MREQNSAAGVGLVNQRVIVCVAVVSGVNADEPQSPRDRTEVDVEKEPRVVQVLRPRPGGDVRPVPALRLVAGLDGTAVDDQGPDFGQWHADRLDDVPEGRHPVTDHADRMTALTWPEEERKVAGDADLHRRLAHAYTMPSGESFRTSGQKLSAAAKPDQLKQDLLPLIKPVKDFIFAFTAGIGRGVLEFSLALLIAGLLYVWGENLGAVLGTIADRLGGESGRRLVHVVESTVRGVFKGLIGTAAVQGVLATFGFWIAGVPNVFILGMATFFISVIPGGPVFLWLPAALWLYANGHIAWAVFMAVWGAGPVSSSNNLILPLLIGKGVEMPSSLIFLGVIGGILAFGFLGLFIGPTMLTIAYNLQDWMVHGPRSPSEN